MESGFSLLRMYWSHEPFGLVIEVLTKAGATPHSKRWRGIQVSLQK